MPTASIIKERIFTIKISQILLVQKISRLNPNENTIAVSSKFSKSHNGYPILFISLSKIISVELLSCNVSRIGTRLFITTSDRKVCLK